MTSIFKNRLLAFVLVASALVTVSGAAGWWFLLRPTPLPPETSLDTSAQSTSAVPETPTDSSSSEPAEPSIPESSTPEKPISEPEEEAIPRINNTALIQQACEDLEKEKKRFNKGDILQVEGYVGGPYVWGDWRRVDLELRPFVTVCYESKYESVSVMCRFEKPFNETELKSLKEHEKVIIQGTYDGYYKLGDAVYIFRCSLIYRGEVLLDSPESVRIYI